jgi:hypothetical protein
LAAVMLTMMSASALAKSTLTLYTSQPNEDAQMTVNAFEKAHPDIEVKWIRDGTTKLTARLQAGVSRWRRDARCPVDRRQRHHGSAEAAEFTGRVSLAAGRAF